MEEIIEAETPLITIYFGLMQLIFYLVEFFKKILNENN